MNINTTQTRRTVSFQETFNALRNLRWKEEHLIDWGAKGEDFAKGLAEELEVAKALLTRKFNAKAKENGLDEKLALRVARLEADIFNGFTQTNTLH